jgi:hypothetical protein
VPISDATLPYGFLIAHVDALLGGIVVAFGLDALGRKPTVTFSYAAAALSMLGCAAAAQTGSETVVVTIAFTVTAFIATAPGSPHTRLSPSTSSPKSPSPSAPWPSSCSSAPSG